MRLIAALVAVLLAGCGTDIDPATATADGDWSVSIVGSGVNCSGTMTIGPGAGVVVADSRNLAGTISCGDFCSGSIVGIEWPEQVLLYPDCAGGLTIESYKVYEWPHRLRGPARWPDGMDGVFVAER